MMYCSPKNIEKELLHTGRGYARDPTNFYKAVGRISGRRIVGVVWNDGKKVFELDLLGAGTEELPGVPEVFNYLAARGIKEVEMR